MKIAILGAGFTGLTAGLKLSQAGHYVTIFEKEKQVGGLAVGFSKKNWKWSLEKGYHHWFTNDDSAINLAKELGQKVLIKRPLTSVFINNQILPLDSPMSLMKFPYFSLGDRVKTASALAFLKVFNDYEKFGDQKALPWIRKYMGEKVTDLIWDPLFTGKFGQYKEEIVLTWFWARIKKRTPSLAYPAGGFKDFAEKIAMHIKQNNGSILLGTEVVSLSSQKTRILITTAKEKLNFDKVLVTLPSPIFNKIAKDLPLSYQKKVFKIPHLHAHNLVLILKKPFMNNVYWLNLTDKNSPFLVLAEHTNFMDKTNYGNNHLLYIGNYLPPDHHFLKMSPKQLLKIFDPYLSIINKNYQKNILECVSFLGPFAQPVVTPGYLNNLPSLSFGKKAFQTPLKNVFIANLDMTYPWDRGTNYAIEMGEKAAKIIG